MPNFTPPKPAVLPGLPGKGKTVYQLLLGLAMTVLIATVAAAIFCIICGQLALRLLQAIALTFVFLVKLPFALFR